MLSAFKEIRLGDVNLICESGRLMVNNNATITQQELADFGAMFSSQIGNLQSGISQENLISGNEFLN